MKTLIFSFIVFFMSISAYAECTYLEETNKIPTNCYVFEWDGTPWIIKIREKDTSVGGGFYVRGTFKACYYEPAVAGDYICLEGRYRGEHEDLETMLLYDYDVIGSEVILYTVSHCSPFFLFDDIVVLIRLDSCPKEIEELEVNYVSQRKTE